jgi:uncharacterized heparinase superfamily protein
MQRREAEQAPRGDVWPWSWPLSGDVAQTFGTWWIKALSAQTGFINVNNVNSGDPRIEQRIVEEVASYGRQLGWILEALDVVVGRLRPEQLPDSDLSAAEREALERLSDLVRRVQAVKGETSPPRLTAAGIDRMLEDLRALEHTDRAAYEAMAARIRDAIDR